MNVTGGTVLCCCHLANRSWRRTPCFGDQSNSLYSGRRLLYLQANHQCMLRMLKGTFPNTEYSVQSTYNWEYKNKEFVNQTPLRNNRGCFPSIRQEMERQFKSTSLLMFLRATHLGKQRLPLFCLLLVCLLLSFLFPKQTTTKSIYHSWLALWPSASCHLLDITVQRHSLCIARFTASRVGSNVLQQHDAEYQSTRNFPTLTRYF